jgi:hypothetical protein
MGGSFPLCRAVSADAQMIKSPFMPALGPRPWALHAIAGALLLIFAIQVFSESSLKTTTFDEPPHIASGLSYVEKGIFQPNPQHPPLLKELSGMALLAGGIRLPRSEAAESMLHGERLENVHPEWGVGNDILTSYGPDRVLWLARLPFIFLACGLGLLVYLWGSQMLGGLAGLGALLLYTLDPSIVAHSFLVTMDVGVTALALLFLFALWHYVAKPSPARLVLCGAALGGALSAKFTALLFLPVAGVLVLAAILKPSALQAGRLRSIFDPFHLEKAATAERRQVTSKPAKGGSTQIQADRPWSLRKRLMLGMGALAAMGVVAFVVIQATYFFPADPLVYYRGLRLVNADHDPNFEVFLAGAFAQHFLSYFAAAYLLKTPLAGIILAVIGIATLFTARSIGWLAKLFVVVPPLVIFVAHSLWADNVGLRYLIPAMPFAQLLGGLGLAAMLRNGKTWMGAAAGGLAVWAALAAFGVYPDHLSYFNETACLLRDPGKVGIDGGTACGPLWLSDSNVDWGQGLKQLKTWLDGNARGRAVRLVNPYGFPPEAYGIRTEPVDLELLVRRPPPGLYAISAHIIAALPPGATEDNWVQSTSPTAIVGHAIYIYDIAEAGSGAGRR